MNDCYKCKYRGTIPGDAHTQCKHPKVNAGDMFAALVAALTGEYAQAAKELNIQGDPHGIQAGWFIWPANFDPVWLRNCDGFTPMEVTER